MVKYLQLEFTPTQAFSVSTGRCGELTCDKVCKGVKICVGEFSMEVDFFVLAMEGANIWVLIGHTMVGRIRERWI